MSELSKRDFIKLVTLGALGGVGAFGVGKAVVTGLDAYRVSENSRRIREELNSNSGMDPDQKLVLMNDLHNEQLNLGWDNLIKEGLPKEAFKSACRISVFDLTINDGSASVLTMKRNTKKYRFIPTAGHILEIMTDNSSVVLFRSEEMGRKTTNKLKRNQFGLSYIDKKGDFRTEEDFGFIVVAEEDAKSSGISDVYPWDEVSSVDDMLFEPLPQNATGLYAIGYPGMLGIAPLACMDGSVKSFEQIQGAKNISVDNCFAYGGNSGTLVYLKRYDGAKPVGVMYSHFDESNTAPDDPNRMYWDNANIFPFSTLRRVRFEEMLHTAIADLESRKG